MNQGSRLEDVVGRIRACSICSAHLPLGPRPLVRVHPDVRILIIGQAPGRRAHERGVPWDDPSGDRLRQWLGVSRAVFYEADRLGLLPMGFCYPGTGSGGDLPPRPECADSWHEEVLERLPRLESTLVIGRYAHRRYLSGASRSVTEAVKAWRQQFPRLIPMPHPSPRNNRWIAANPWFEEELVPALRAVVARSLRSA